MPIRRLKAGGIKSAAVFAALGHETRLRLMVRLGRDGPISVTSLTSHSSISRQAISKHLGVLTRAGLVKGARRGREQLYQLDAQQIQEAKQYLDVISQQWDDALGRLKGLVETR